MYSRYGSSFTLDYGPREANCFSPIQSRLRQLQRQVERAKRKKGGPIAGTVKKESGASQRRPVDDPDDVIDLTED